MNYKILGLVVIALFLAAPVSTNAQVTTLDYQGSIMTGVVLTYDGHDPPTSSPYSGTFSATVVLDGTIGANDISVTSYNVSGPVSINGGPLGSSDSNLNWLLGPGELSLTTSQDKITGATFQYSESPGNGAGDASFSITPSGDSFAVGNFGPGTGIGTQIYGGGSAGVWTVTSAPEINPASAASGLTLLLGGLAVLRGRRAKAARSD